MIRLQNVSKYYYSDSSVTLALRKINIDFPETGFVCITGESGSGKSTLLNIISGLDTFDDGEMYYNNEPTFQFDDADWEEYRRNEIGFVFQNYGLIGHYSARDNVAGALLIQEKSMNDAVKQADAYLEQVGLKGYENQKASELSSGQKQRLSIARALAKNTNIIVADEPTGNLDSQTSAQIIELLKTLSKDHLIIMVTHNYEQVENVATRKIRLHDGELVNDFLVNEQNEDETSDKEALNNKNSDKEASDNNSEKKISSPETNNKNDISNIKNNTKKKKIFNLNKKEIHTALQFFKMNVRGQKSRAFLFFSFFLLTAILSFVFLGELYVNRDDRATKKFDTTAFLNKSDKRLLVRRTDGQEITTSDLKTFNKLKYVTESDMYENCNDISYYINKGEDYYYKYSDKVNDQTQVAVKLKKTGKYMHSTSCIDKSDLKSGKMPSARNEIAIYSDDASVLGTYVNCYFTDNNLWDNGQYYYKSLKIRAV